MTLLQEHYNFIGLEHSLRDTHYDSHTSLVGMRTALAVHVAVHEHHAQQTTAYSRINASQFGRTLLCLQQLD
jgi:hypothetical protein